MRTGLSLVELATRIEDLATKKEDLIVPTRDIEMIASAKGANANSMRLALPVPKASALPVQDGRVLTELKNTAHDQIGSHLEIPAKYYDRMLHERPQLLADNVNTWLRAAKPSDRRMVRTLEGKTRGFLSNRYQRIENEEIAGVVLPILLSTPGIRVVSTEVTDRRLYIQATTDRVTGEVKKGDAVQAGIVIGNSEIGYGSVSIKAMVYRLVCLNGMILPDSFRQNHIGRKIEDNEDLYRDDTKAADDKAVLLKVRDTITGFLTREFFERKLSALQGLTEGKFEGNVEKGVEVLAKKIGANDAERQGILRSLIEGGDLSRWGVLNAVTHQAHTIADYDRSVEFESAGGKLIDLPAKEWNEVLRAS